MVQLNRTYYSLLNYTRKIFFKIWSVGQNSNKFSKIRSNIPRITQNSHRLLIYLYYVSGTGRERSGIPANYVNSAQFAHKVRELRKIRTFLLTYLMFQTPAPAENSQEFRRIMQIPRSLPT